MTHAITAEPALFATVLRDVSVFPIDVQFPEALRFRVQPTFSDIVLEACIHAATFLPISILLVFGFASISQPPASSWGSILVFALLLSPFAIPFVAVPFLPVALLRSTRPYGHSSTLSRWYGSIIGLLLWPLLWFGSRVTEALSPEHSSGPAPFFLFLVSGALAVALAEAFLLQAHRSAA